MSTFKRAISYARPYKSTFSIAIVFNILYAIFNVIALVSMMPILSILFDEERKEVATQPLWDKVDGIGSFKNYVSDFVDFQLQEWAAQLGGEKTLLIACSVFLVAFLLRNLFSYFSEYFLIDLRTGVSVDIREEIHNKILQLPVSYFTEKKKGDIITRITSDVGEVEGSILNGLVEIIRSPIMIIISFITLFTMSAKLTLFTIVVFPIMGTIISLIGKSLKKNAGFAQREFEKLISYIDETLVGNKIIKIFNAENQMMNRFNHTLSQYRKYLVKVGKKRALASPTSEFLGGITIALLVYFGGTLSLQGEGLQGSAFVTYIGLFYTMLDPIKKFSKSISDIQKGEVSANRIFELLDTHVSIEDSPNAVSIDSFTSQIEFKNVSFKYEKDWIIRNFNLRLEKGKMVALVGHSGSGKSTLANLITRFYDVTEGEILIDGVNIKDIKLKDYRALFGMVTQDSILFNDSIKNNITLGSDIITQKKVENAADIANASEFITKLEEGYDASVGESGNKLSGGQKQRLSIARAVYKNPPIMVLDEATSALDTQSEKLVQDALEHMMENRTSLVIAHRLSTIQNADTIVVMNEGKIVEQGSHQELMAKNSYYTQLVQLQNLER